MADVTKEKVLQINTTGAEKNVKSLKTQIKELKEQLAQLEVGTAEYNQIVKLLADTNQKQIEINEAMKYSNQDLGQTLSNLSTVSAGVIGAIQGVNVVMQLFGASEEDASKATKSLQQSMALIQSLTAIDNARKSFEGLKNAFTDLGKSSKDTDKLSSSEERLSNSVKKTTAAETRETATLNTNTKAKKTNTTATTAMATKTNVARTAVTTLTTGIKNMTKALLSNPFTIFMAASAAAITVITNLIQKNKELKEAAEEHKKAEEERALALNNLPNDFNLIENSVKWANSGMEELTNSSSKLYKEIQKLAGEIQRQEPDKKSRAWQVAFSRAYEDAVKAGDKEKKNLIELTRLQWEYYRVNRANYESYADYLKAQDEALAKLYSTYISQSKSTTTNTTRTVVRSLKDLVEEFKKLYKEFLNEAFNWTNYKSIFNGFYHETETLLDKIKHLIKTNSLEMSQEFWDAMDNGDLTGLTQYDITLNFLFDQQKLKELEETLAAEEETLRKYTTKEIKATEKALEAQRKKVTEIKQQIAAYNELAETVVKYLAVVKENRDKYGETATRKKNEALERERQLYLDYITDVKNRNPWAELNNTLATTQNELEEVRVELQEINAEEAELVKKGLYNKESVNRYREIAARREELMCQATELERTLDDTNYQIRLKHINDLYEAEKEAAKQLNQELENKRNARGGGVVDYNTDVDMLTNELNAILFQMGTVEDYFDTEIAAVQEKYKELLLTVAEGSEEFVKIESERDEQMIQMTIEREAAITQLEQDEAEKRAEITQAEFERKAKIQKAYMNSLSSITSQISSLLGEKMNAYDSDSEEYKRLQITQATINTISGALSAFVSGFQSGIPWPGNLILAGVLSGLVYATGRQSIENIKNESLKNGAQSSATTGNFSEYDTLSYMQNSEILGNIQDTRVYVVESDITSTQNRVQVAETQATF